MLQKDYSLQRIKVIIVVILFGSQHSLAQKTLTPGDSIKFFSKNCGTTVTYIRQYLNDSTFVDRFDNINDTMIVEKGKASLFRMNMKYDIIDIHSDFSTESEFKYHSYYFGLHANDTAKKTSESNLSFRERLSEHIVIYIPKDQIKIENRDVYIYYVIDKCYPVSKEVIQARIANHKYGLIYFEEGIGIVGRSASRGSCGLYFIDDKSYASIKKR